MTAATHPVIVHTDGAYCITFWQNLAIVDVRGCVDVPHMLTLERAYRALADRFAGGIISCVVLRPGTPVSPPDALKESARFMRDLGDAVLRIAVVIEDRGVMAQVFRSVIRGVNVVTRNNKLVVFDDLNAAIDALAPLTVPVAGQMDVAGALAMVLDSARARYSSIPPSILAVASERRPSAPSLRG